MKTSPSGEYIYYLESGGQIVLCEKCKTKPANVHIEKSVNGKKTSLNLCQDCSGNIGTVASLDALFGGQIGPKISPFVSMSSSVSPANAGRRQTMQHNYEPCAICGMSYPVFKSTNRFGCENCYKTFNEEFQAIIKRVQASSKHEGKYPKRFGCDTAQIKDVSQLRALMSEAIQNENFEEAARLRDEIRNLEASEEL